MLSRTEPVFQLETLDLQPGVSLGPLQNHRYSFDDLLWHSVIWDINSLRFKKQLEWIKETKYSLLI